MQSVNTATSDITIIDIVEAVETVLLTPGPNQRGCPWCMNPFTDRKPKTYHHRIYSRGHMIALHRRCAADIETCVPPDRLGKAWPQHE